MPEYSLLGQAVDDVTSHYKRHGLRGFLPPELIESAERVPSALMALSDLVGPAADVKDMKNYGGATMDSLKGGNYSDALANMLMTGAAVGMTALPGSVGAVEEGVNLATDTASRMKRAEDMGFDLSRPVYHSTAKDFNEFDPERAIGSQFWSTTNKKAVEAGEVGAQGRGVVKEMYHRIKNPAGWDEYDRFGIDELIALGYDGLALPDGDGHITYVAFEPNQYRDVKAAFDPAKKDSANLLASIGGAGLLGLGVSQRDDQ